MLPLVIKVLAGVATVTAASVAVAHNSKKKKDQSSDEDNVCENNRSPEVEKPSGIGQSEYRNNSYTRSVNVEVNETQSNKEKAKTSKISEDATFDALMAEADKKIKENLQREKVYNERKSINNIITDKEKAQKARLDAERNARNAAQRASNAEKRANDAELENQRLKEKISKLEAERSKAELEKMKLEMRRSEIDSFDPDSIDPEDDMIGLDDE